MPASSPINAGNANMDTYVVSSGYSNRDEGICFLPDQETGRWFGNIDNTKVKVNRARRNELLI